ncbi:MAG: transposase [Geitlerinemataceae cyanobacterium]
MLNLTYCYRIYPNQEQASRMEAWLEQLRQVYNYALAERKIWIKSRKCEVNFCSLQGEYILPVDSPKPTFYSQKKSLTEARKQHPEIADLHSQVLQEVLGRVDLTFKTMWDRGLGFPRFKKTGRLRSMVFPQLKSNPIVTTGHEERKHESGDRISSMGCDNWQLKLPKIGTIPIALHRLPPSRFVVKQIRVLRKASGWFALLALQANISISEPKPGSPMLGIHFGKEILLATSDGERIARPRFFEKRQRQLKLLQRRLKRKNKGSNNSKKLHRRIARSYERIDAAKKDYYYNVAHRLCDRAGTICSRDWTVNRINDGEPFGNLPDADNHRFVHILAGVCWKRGVYFDRVEVLGAERMCPQCGVHISNSHTRDRAYRCPECQYQTDREVGAAQALVQRGLAAVGHAVARADRGSLECIACGGERPGAAA